MRTTFAAPSFVWQSGSETCTISSTNHVEACVSEHTNPVVRRTLPNMGLCRRGGFAAQSYGSGLSRRALRPPVLIRAERLGRRS
jgi:hypothetical protein